MYKQTEQKQELMAAIQDFHHEFINENLMIQHKMLGENHQRDLNQLFALFQNAFDFTGMQMVSFKNRYSKATDLTWFRILFFC